VKLIVVHYHLRPGGIRRIIELAVPHLVREAPQAISQVIFATGQHANRQWHAHFDGQLPDVPVKVIVEPSFNYLSEQTGSPSRIAAKIHHALDALLKDADAGNCIVWAHNLGVGRNLILARELAAACAARNITLVAHHHDWWFDNRWARWPEMRRFGFRTLAAPAQAVFPKQRGVVHAAINHADAAILSRHFGRDAFWSPNLTGPATPPPGATVQNTHRWLRNKLSHDGAPIWLLPCRTLRRKNIAEALLLARWLRPDARLVVTGAASSADEAAYFNALETAGHRHHWRFRLGVLAGDESRKPRVPDLLAASEAVLLTSIQEGFGLPYLEAAAAGRPLIARRLPNIAPDLRRFGFRFPQSYDEILIAPGLFDWNAERRRQSKLLAAWRGNMPLPVHKLVSLTPVLAAKRPQPVPFSRLTLTAQLEVLARPLRESWSACAALNPFLEDWRSRGDAGQLLVSPWPRSANRWLGGEAYARRFFKAVAAASKSYRRAFTAKKVQDDFIRSKLDAHNLYPLLWNRKT
jgi:glycosyltransferase involved in cell wall biosynthesis